MNGMIIISRKQIYAWNAFKLLGFRYSARGPFTNSKLGNQKFKETEESQYTHQNEIDKAFNITLFMEILKI